MGCKMPNDHERRISANEANIASIREAIKEISALSRGYMEDGVDFRTETAATLGEQLVLLRGFVDYQKKCDADRDSIRTAMQDEKNARSRAMGFTAGAAAAFSGICTVVGVWWSNR